MSRKKSTMPEKKKSQTSLTEFSNLFAPRLNKYLKNIFICFTQCIFLGCQFFQDTPVTVDSEQPDSQVVGCYTVLFHLIGMRYRIIDELGEFPEHVFRNGIFSVRAEFFEKLVSHQQEFSCLPTKENISILFRINRLGFNFFFILFFYLLMKHVIDSQSFNAFKYHLDKLWNDV